MASGNIWQLFQDLDVEEIRDTPDKSKTLLKSKSSSNIIREKSPNHARDAKDSNSKAKDEKQIMRKKSSSDATALIAKLNYKNRKFKRSPSALMGDALQNLKKRDSSENPLMKSQSSRGNIFRRQRASNGDSDESLQNVLNRESTGSPEGSESMLNEEKLKKPKLFARRSFSKAKEKGWQFVKKVGIQADKILQGQGSKESDTSSSSGDNMESEIEKVVQAIQDLNTEMVDEQRLILSTPDPSLVRKKGSVTNPDLENIHKDSNSSGEMNSAVEDFSLGEEKFFDAESNIINELPILNFPMADESSDESSICGIFHIENDDRETPVRGDSISSPREVPMLTLEDLQSLNDKIRLPEPGEPPRFVMFLDPNCPCHGDVQNKHDACDPVDTSETDTSVGTFNISEYDSPILSSQAYAAKLMRKRTRARMRTQGETEGNIKEMRKIKSNLFMISMAFLVLFSGFQGLQNLQTSINSENGLGALSLAVCYFGVACSTLFLPSYLLNRLGCKYSMILCMCVYTLYMLANFNGKPYSLIPASFILGAAASCLWTAKCTYLTEIGIRYAALNVESPNVVIVRFFGIFFMIVHFGQVLGNLCSHLIFSAAVGPKVIVDEIQTNCGRYFTGYSNSGDNSTDLHNLNRPPQRIIAAVIAVYLACTLISIMIVAFFVNGLRRDTIESKMAPNFNLHVFRKTITYLRIPKHCFVIPLTIFNGMEQAFIAGEFTRAYVGCSLGVEWIGSVLTAFGVADAICSLVFGPLIKLFGRMPLFMFGGVVDMLMMFTLLIWQPNAADTGIYFAIATAWGMADGVWNTQINGLWVVLCSQNLQVAFANYRLWESVGMMIAFSITPYTSTSTKLYLLLACLFIGMIGYGIIEMWQPLQDYVDKVESAGKRMLQHTHEMSQRRRKNVEPSSQDQIPFARSVSFVNPDSRI